MCRCADTAHGYVLYGIVTYLSKLIAVNLCNIWTLWKLHARTQPKCSGAASQPKINRPTGMCLLSSCADMRKVCLWLTENFTIVL